jgi:hypothetical protein
MSFSSWKAEFYPIPVEATTPDQAIEHSLQKWRGSLPENLKKHEVDFEDKTLYDGLMAEDLLFDSRSCALCFHYIRTGCESCPIGEYKIAQNPDFDFGGNACGKEYSLSGSGLDRPATSKPMIDLLEEVLKFKQKT